MNEQFRRSNGAAQNVVVMKFGGTSVEDAPAIRRLVHLVQDRLNLSPVVVVSAFAKVTDQLIAIGRAAERGDVPTAEANVAALRARHEQVASELLQGEDLSQLRCELEGDFAALQQAAQQVAASGEFSARAQDHLLGFGECLSSKVVSAALRRETVKAALVDARSCIVTDSRHTQAAPLWELTSECVQRVLHPLLKDRYVPVLGGFIASTRDGVPTTLGRGGSDLTAAIVGAVLHAKRIEIWTDVDGVMSGDPGLCADARVIARMSFDEAAELAHFGAKVLHPATLSPAMRKNIPVYVLNSRNPKCEGTEIVAHVAMGNSVRAVTAKRDVAAVEIEMPQGVSPELLHSLHATLDRHHCCVHVMGSTRDRVSLLVSGASALPAVAADLQGLANVRWENHKALVCLVGDNIRRQPTVVSRVFAAVSDLDARVVCQGASDRTISFLVDDSKAVDSVQRLHGMFFPRSASRVGSEPPPKLPPEPALTANSNALCQAGDSWQ
jgi:aspartate kinase